MFYAHPASVPRIAEHTGVVRSGASAAIEHGLPLVGGGPLNAYVRSGELARLLEEVPMEEGADPCNVRLRTVQDACWPFPPDAVTAPLAVVAVDLAESPNARERRLGGELLARL